MWTEEAHRTQVFINYIYIYIYIYIHTTQSVKISQKQDEYEAQ